MFLLYIVNPNIHIWGQTRVLCNDLKPEKEIKNDKNFLHPDNKETRTTLIKSCCSPFIVHLHITLDSTESRVTVKILQSYCEDIAEIL